MKTHPGSRTRKEPREDFALNSWAATWPPQDQCHRCRRRQSRFEVICSLILCRACEQVPKTPPAGKTGTNDEPPVRAPLWRGEPVAHTRASIPTATLAAAPVPGVNAAFTSIETQEKHTATKSSMTTKMVGKPSCVSPKSSLL